MMRSLFLSFCSVFLLIGHGAFAMLEPTDFGWPREATKDRMSVTIYQPDVEKWSGNRIVERAAFSILEPGFSEPIYGVSWIAARTEVDRANHWVSLEDLQITRVQLTEPKNRGLKYVAILKETLPDLIQPIALDRLITSLDASQGKVVRNGSTALSNVPPDFIYSSVPAVLVPIDGDPVFSETSNPNFKRMVNTPALILQDRSSKNLYIAMGGRWVVGSEKPRESLDNVAWSIATAPPKELEQLRLEIVSKKGFSLLDEPSSIARKAFDRGITPRICVRTYPSVLLQSEGAVSLKYIPGTMLQYVENSADMIFTHFKDRTKYALISGRWYRAPIMFGPWRYVSPSKLPDDFSRIPENHPRAAALTFIAGTAQARLASIANEIPQTATIVRSQAHLEVSYDRAPVFRPIEGTSLRYAVNTETPVIEVGPHSYYSVNLGVWFFATSPKGPWIVADRVPSVISRIPPSSSLYPVTFVHVYGSTPEVVYVGYTPGYLGSYTTADGVVVFGTGYVYPHWVGSTWIAPPQTFELDTHWKPESGWAFVGPVFSGFNSSPAFLPWWGPWKEMLKSEKDTKWNWNPLGPALAMVERQNVYESWPRASVMNSWETHEYANGAPFKTSKLPDAIFSNREGKVFRFVQNQWQNHWEVREGSRWLPRFSAPRGEAAGIARIDRASPHPADELERSLEARRSGERQWSEFRSLRYK